MVVILGSYNPNLEQRTEPEPQSRDEAEDYGVICLRVHDDVTY